MRHHRWLLGLGLLSASAIAQQRSPFFATVRDPDDKPLAGAEVTCVFTPSLLVPGTADVVCCTTDALGRARADLRLGLVYVAWAIGPVDAKGTCSVSEPRQLVAAGRVVALSAWATRRSRKFALPSAAAWQPAGATGVRWFPVAGQEAYVDLPLPAEGEIALPPSPWATGSLALVDASGERLVTAVLPPAATEAPEFAAPELFTVRVSDDGGKPVVGASIEHGVSTGAALTGLFGWTGNLSATLRRAAVTEPDGTASFVVPHSTTGLVVRASAPGFGWAHASFALLDPLKSMELLPATPTTLRIAGAGQAKLTLGAQAPYHARHNKGMAVGQHPVVVEPKDATTWLVHAPNSVFTPRLAVQNEGVPIAAVLDWIEKPPATLTIDLTRHQRVEVRVLGPDGGPPGCVLAVARQEEGHPVYWEQILAADSAGRATLLLPSASFFVYATNGSAHALALVDAAAKEPLALKLEPLPTMRLWVRNADGQPVAGARAKMQRSVGGRGAPDALSQQRYRVAYHVWRDYVALPSSGPDGGLDVPLFLPDGMRATVQVSAGTLLSALFDIGDGAERTVTVK